MPATWRQHARDLRCLWRRWLLCRGVSCVPASTRSLLVVAPHPDDETFGCGSLISFKRTAGADVRIVFLTNGEAALKNHCSLSPAHVGRIRREQAVQACRHLGVDESHLRWYSWPDGGVPRKGSPGFAQAVKQIMAEIQDHSSAEVVSSHALDLHADHRAAGELVHEAGRQLGPQVRLFYYILWTWYRAGRSKMPTLPLALAWKLEEHWTRAQKQAAISEYLDGPLPACGIRYCGDLPTSFVHLVKRADEIFFDDHPSVITSRPL